MTPERQAAVKALMGLFPPHPKAHGRLDGLDEAGEKKNFTINKPATEKEYLWHLSTSQSTPRGIGMYGRHEDIGYFLTFDIDDKTERGRHVALVLFCRQCRK